MAEYNRPLPQITSLTEPFWEATKRHELLIQKCSHCGAYRFSPREACPNCISTDYEWSKVSGEGTVYSYTVMHGGLPAAWRDHAPYVIALVDLKEGARVMSHIVGCSPDDVKVGMPVKLTWEDVSEVVSLYKFQPA